jgi:hypothetical protein
MDYMIRHNGRDLGPYSEAEVRERLIAGTLALSDFGLTDGVTEWAPLLTFPQFATTYRQPPIPPPIPRAIEEPKAEDVGPRIETRNLGSYTAATLQPNERPLHHTTIH